jgi:two-component system response regulator NreC
MNVKGSTQVVLSSDYAITREGLRSLLREAPEIKVTGEAETIAATPKKVRELAPDVALMELSGSSRTHGLRAVAEIAQQSPDAKIVVLTNNCDLPYVRSMLACGVSAYLLKNCTTAQLLAAVRNVTRGSRIIDPTLGSDLIWHMRDRKTRQVRPQFSRRELEVFTALMRGYTNSQSANVLGVGIKTVETYRLRLYRKLNVRSRAELVEYALAHRLSTDNV